MCDWIVLRDGILSAEENMTRDAELLDSLKKESNPRPLLRFYRWKGDCGTYGYFIQPGDYLNLEGVKKRELSLARRPTGGGILFHMTDLAFSVIVPAQHKGYSQNTLENYAFVNRAVSRAVTPFLPEEQREKLQLLPEEPQPADEASRSFCMAKPTKYDVIVRGKKVGGAAQRKKNYGFLHQGTLSLAPVPADYLGDVLLPGTAVFQAMKENSFFLLKEEEKEKQLEGLRRELTFSIERELCINSFS